jgi:hypothetical protein
MAAQGELMTQRILKRLDLKRGGCFFRNAAPRSSLRYDELGTGLG